MCSDGVMIWIWCGFFLVDEALLDLGFFRGGMSI